MSVAVSFLSKSFRSRASFANFALSIIATLLFPAPKAQNDLNTSSILILVFLEFSFDGLMFLAAAYTHVARGTNTLLKFATRLARIMLEFIIQSLIVGARLHRKQFIKGGALATTGACETRLSTMISSSLAPYLMCYFLLDDIMGLHLPSLGILVPEKP